MGVDTAMPWRMLLSVARSSEMRGQIAFAQAHFLALDISDVGVNAHPPAVAGAPLA